MTLAPETKLGRYEIRSKLGAGGMGEVYLAQDTKLERTVALKILPADVAADRQRMQRFIQEAKAASGLNHPNICTIYEINDEHDVLFIAMEYIEGETISEKIEVGGFDLTETLELALQIADALAEAHEHGIVHRDVKPANIMVNRRGQVKILDFGLAKKIAADAEAETQQFLSQAGIILGTVAYMSPEQARGATLDARTDVWSLGVVLYEMIAGEKPFSGTTTTDLLAAILRSEPESMRKFNRELPPKLERIVLKALRKDRDERYQLARDLFSDLKQVKRDLDFTTAREMSGPPGVAGEFSAGVHTSLKGGSLNAVAEPLNSIAVLPFTNLSAEAENEYFCDGLAEELLNALAKIEDLKVAARTSSFSFKGKNTSIGEIGRALAVDTVLEGSVRKASNRLRITVQLVNAADGYHLWSERYDREMQDIFDVQDDITLSVVDALKVKLLGTEKATVLKRYTKNTEAFELYLKGRYFWLKFNPESWKKALECFEQAIQKDPTFALAYSGLADAFVAVGVFTPPKEIYPQAKEAVLQALKLDPSIAEIWCSKAAVRFFHEWNWAGAIADCNRSIELNPRYTLIHDLYSLCLVTQGKFEDAISEARRAVELEPLSSYFNGSLGCTLFLSRRFDEANDQLLKGEELDPGLVWSHMWLVDLYEQIGGYAQALHHRQKMLALAGNNELAVEIGQEFQRSGYRGVLLKCLDELHRQSKTGYVSPLDFAKTYVRLDEQDKAMDWLEKAYEERTMYLSFLRVSPVWDSLHSQPRYVDLLRRLGLKTGYKSFERSITGASEAQTVLLAPTATDANENLPTVDETVRGTSLKPRRAWLPIALLCLLLVAVGVFAYRSFTADTRKQIESIAVLPFKNESGNTDIEYLSDGMTESLINSLSQLPNLSVKARSSVFRYKGKEVEPQQVAKELSVQAILNGRVVQRGEDLALYLSLVDARTGNQLWGEQYNRKLTDLVSLQSEIARDVSGKLRARLSGADEQKLAKNYTANTEAYQLYLKGRYHVLKLRRSETQKGISYFQQAIEHDPTYALAYVGLAEAYRSLALTGEMPPTEFLPKAKAAAQKAIEIDATLAEAHALLGYIIFWYDWNWDEAEKQSKRALELNPNSAESHQAYALLLSATGQHVKALAEAKRALELDPLNLRINAVQGEFLIYAGQADEALARLQKTFELDPNFWVAHLFASSAYSEKGMFAEAVVEARKARELSDSSTRPTAFLGYALAKSGKQAEARAELGALMKLSSERWVAPSYIAMIYHGLGERDETLAWLERGFEKRDARMVFLKVEPKWNNLRDDPRFQDLLRRMRFEP
jgi:TolB-like protein/Tfp pilus assembly protein PilF